MMKILLTFVCCVVWLEICSAAVSKTANIEDAGIDRVMNSACMETPKRGSCLGGYNRWYYDTKKMKCKKFKYGGCGGNNNRFYSWGQCVLQCPYKKSINFNCLEPKIVGPCHSSLKRFYYNTVTERCEFFYYGGCKGSNNRFETRRDCESNCPARQGCLQPKKRGSCNKYLPRFYFSRRTKQCEHFIYGGCHGNGNNFVTRASCEKECPIEVRKSTYPRDQIFF